MDQLMYKDRELYQPARRFRIAMNQQPEDVFIYNPDDEVTVKTISNYSIKSPPAHLP